MTINRDLANLVPTLYQTSSKILVGITTARSDFFNQATVNPKFQVETAATDNLNRFISVTSNNSDTGGATLLLAKTRGTTVGSVTVVQNDDQIGAVSFQGADGANLVEAARIQASVDGTPGSDDMPGSLRFYTTADGAASATERMRITSSGNVGIGTNNPGVQLDIKGPSQGTQIRFAGSGSIINRLYGDDDGIVILSADTNNTAAGSYMAFQVDGTERARIPAAGGWQVVNCASVGNATPSTSGAGITFPATQSASTDANTLDDYEEGSFTPTARGGSTAGTTTYSTQIGRYVKVGKQVTVSLDLGVTGMTGTGNLEIASLPFAAGGSETVSIGAMMTNNLDWPSGTCPVAYVNPGNLYLNIWVSADNAGWAIQAVDTDFRVITTITYFV